MFSGLDKVLSSLFTGLLIATPLALWKLVDIAIWLYNHIEVNVK